MGVHLVEAVSGRKIACIVVHGLVSVVARNARSRVRQVAIQFVAALLKDAPRDVSAHFVYRSGTELGDKV